MCEISVVIPVYNGEKYLEEAIRSVLQQTFQNFELIVVNDGSTDRTKEIIEKYINLDKRVRAINNEKNLKLPGSLNEGFRAAQGRYYTWTSDDNIFLPNAFKEMFEYLEKNVEIGMVYCDYASVDENGKRTGTKLLSNPHVLPQWNCIGACFLYQRSIAEEVGEYDVNMFLAEDYDYWLRIYQKSKIAHLDEILYLYREHKNSLSSTRLKEVKTQTVKLWMKHFDFIIGQMDYSERIAFFDRVVSYIEKEDNDGVIKKLTHYMPFYRLHLLKKRFVELVKLS